MIRIITALGVSKSSLYPSKNKNERQIKISEFKEYLKKLFLEVCSDRPTYGYPRVTAIINRINKTKGFPRINHKRIYRMMKENNLLLQKNEPRLKRIHEGKIITLRSNIRWCSDMLGIRCWDGHMVHVAFVMDCHDREVISFIASNGGIDGEMIRIMIHDAKEKRFGNLQAPRTQFLSDNGPQYTSHATRNFLECLGYEVCHTPAYSPETNGMAESFVKTLKRDYAYVNKLSNAKTVLEILPLWISDYNTFAPHKGLNMKSPKEFMESMLDQAV
jgi:transposase InsO family protein